MAEKVTSMVLKVDLQCPCCYKKTKKILCKFPEIRDQVYDEKGNTVTITVVCCSPEKIRDKLCRKGGKVIKSIEIKEPPKPKEPEKKKESDKTKVIVVEKPNEPGKGEVVVVEKPKPNGKGSEKPKEPEKGEVVVVEKPKPNGKGSDAAAAAEKKKEIPKSKPPESNPPPSEPVQVTVPVNGFPTAFPAMPCCGPSYNDGYGGWPCYHGFGVPPPPQPCYDGYYGCDQYGRCYHVRRCDSYFSEENPSACLIM